METLLKISSAILSKGDELKAIYMVYDTMNTNAKLT